MTRVTQALIHCSLATVTLILLISGNLNEFTFIQPLKQLRLHMYDFTYYLVKHVI